MLVAGCLAIVEGLVAEGLPVPASDSSTVLSGLASHYGKRLHGRRTASGETLDRAKFTAASNHFPLGALVAVQRSGHPACAVVRINDRMHRRHRVRIIDVTHEVAEQLAMLRAGVVRVEVQALPAGVFQPGMVPCADLRRQALATDCLGCAVQAQVGLAGPLDEIDDSRGLSTAIRPSTEGLLQ